MLSVSLGPLTLSVAHLLILGSLLLAVVIGWWVGRSSGSNPESQLFSILIVGLLVARLAFVLRYLPLFADDPWGVLDIRDGGFIVEPGALAALAFGVWILCRKPKLRKPLGIGMSVGVLVWAMGSMMLSAFEQGTRMPEVALRDASGAPVQLQDYVGKPVVINLWATWCPPCRREMPVLAEAQAANSEITFLFVNQGEGAEEIQRFLAHSKLELNNVLLDSGGRLGQRVGSMSLPTTLFYSAQGRQLGSHLGELSKASLTQALEHFDKDVHP